jgi:hypothetical protein
MRDFANGRLDIWRRCAAEVSLVIVIGPLFAWIGPFGTAEAGPVESLMYWCSLLAIWFVSVALTETLLGHSERFRSLSPKMRRTATILLAAMPMMVAAASATHALSGWRSTTDEVLELYVQIIVLGSIALFSASVMMPQWRKVISYLAPMGPTPEPAQRRPTIEHVYEEEQPPTASTGGRLNTRLPPRIRGRIICLEMQDHYVRVHTDLGSALVLMRLGDAISEVDAGSGRQVHRSWWVLDEAVEGFERVGRTGVLSLGNGLRVPVPQRYLRDVEAAHGES